MRVQTLSYDTLIYLRYLPILLIIFELFSLKSSETGEYQATGRLQKKICIDDPQVRAFKILKWKKVGTTRSQGPAKLGNWYWYWASVREVTKNQMVTLAELQWSCVELGVTPGRTTITATLQWLGLYGRVASGRPLLKKTHESLLWHFMKAPKRHSDGEKQDYLVRWSQNWTVWPKFSVLCLEVRGHHSSPAHHISNAKAW